MTMLKDMVEPKALLGMQQAAGLVAWFVAEGDALASATALEGRS